MRFLIQRASANWKDVTGQGPPCRAAEGSPGWWWVELDSLDDLMELSREVGHLDVSSGIQTPTIEILDGPAGEPRGTDMLVAVQPAETVECGECGRRVLR